MKKLFWFLLVGCVCAAMTVSYAQELTKGMIVGKAIDDKGDPLPGVAVTTVSERGVSKSTVSEADGTFRLPFLVPGTYSIKLEMENFKTYEKAEITVPLNARIDVGTVTMQLGGKGEVITVTGNPVVDLSSSSASANIPEVLIKNIPIGRTFASALFLAPSVTNSGLNRNNPSISGASALENSYLIDGVNVTTVGYGSLGDISMGAFAGGGINVDYVKEVQVKAGGIEAEYGQALGGVINVITKSGGNLFDGDAFVYFQPGTLESERKLVHTDTGFTNTVEYQTWDVGFDAGGKIMKDKLFWFAAFDPQEIKITRQAPDNVDENGNYVYPLRTLLPDGKEARKSTIYNYAGKLSWNLTANNIVELSVFGDPVRINKALNERGFLRQDHESGLSTIKMGSNNQVLRWTSMLTPKLFFEAQVANHNDVYDFDPVVKTESISDLRTLPYQYLEGMGSIWAESGKNLQFNAKLTQIYKNHEMKYGIAFEKIHFDVTGMYTGTPHCYNYYDADTGNPKQACGTSGNSVRVRRRSLCSQVGLSQSLVVWNYTAAEKGFLNQEVRRGAWIG